MVNITSFTAAAKSVVEIVSRSPYLKSLENIGNDTVKAVLEKMVKEWLDLLNMIIAFVIILRT